MKHTERSTPEKLPDDGVYRAIAELEDHEKPLCVLASEYKFRWHDKVFYWFPNNDFRRLLEVRASKDKYDIVASIAPAFYQRTRYPEPEFKQDYPPLATTTPAFNSMRQRLPPIAKNHLRAISYGIYDLCVPAGVSRYEPWATKAPDGSITDILNLPEPLAPTGIWQPLAPDSTTDYRLRAYCTIPNTATEADKRIAASNTSTLQKTIESILNKYPGWWLSHAHLPTAKDLRQFGGPTDFTAIFPSREK